MLFRSWVDRWTGAPNYADAYRQPTQVDVIAPTHGHYDHVGNDAADVVELAEGGGTVIGSHELQIYLASLGVQCRSSTPNAIGFSLLPAA